MATKFEVEGVFKFRDESSGSVAALRSEFAGAFEEMRARIDGVAAAERALVAETGAAAAGVEGLGAASQQAAAGVAEVERSTGGAAANVAGMGEAARKAAPEVAEVERQTGRVASTADRATASIGRFIRGALGLAAIKKGFKELGEAAEKSGGAVGELAAAQAVAEEASNRLGAVLAILATGTAAAIGVVSDKVLTLVEVVVKAVGGLASLASNLPIVGDAMAGVADRAQALDERIDAWQSSIARGTEAMAAAIPSLAAYATGALDIEEASKRGDAATAAFALGMERLSERAKSAKPEIDKLARSSDEMATSTGSAIEQTQGLTRALPAAQTVVRATARDFDLLAAAIGRAAAAEELAAQGAARITQGGTRVRFRGGSRLTSEPGLTGYTDQRRSSSLSPGLSGGTFVV